MTNVAIYNFLCSVEFCSKHVHLYLYISYTTGTFIYKNSSTHNKNLTSLSVAVHQKQPSSSNTYIYNNGKLHFSWYIYIYPRYNINTLKSALIIICAFLAANWCGSLSHLNNPSTNQNLYNWVLISYWLWSFNVTLTYKIAHQIIWRQMHEVMATIFQAFTCILIVYK